MFFWRNGRNIVHFGWGGYRTPGILHQRIWIGLMLSGQDPALRAYRCASLQAALQLRLWNCAGIGHDLLTPGLKSGARILGHRRSFRFLFRRCYHNCVWLFQGFNFTWMDSADRL